MGQGGPTNGGMNLGGASATLRFDAQTEQARAQIKTFAADTERSMDKVSQSVSQAEASLASARASVQQLASTSTTSLAQARAAVQQFAQAQQQSARTTAQVQIQQIKAVAQAQQQANRNSGLGKFAGGVAGAALGSIGGPIGSIAGAAMGGGGAAGIAAAVGAGVVQMARAAIEGEKLATTYERQSVAARSMAGSQAELNELLEAYGDATGGAVGKAQALADVTKLQAIGFANNAAELKRFVTVARGISLATGQSQDYVVSQLQLAIANKSTLRLDQLGLGVGEVEKRIDDLRKSNKGLSEDQVYLQAVMGLAEQKFGALTASIEGQATGVERLTAAWADLQLEMAKSVKGPTDAAAGGLADTTNWFADEFEKQRKFNEGAPARRNRAFDDAGITDIIARSIGVDPTLYKAQRLKTMQQPDLLPSAANQSTPTFAPSPRYKDEQIAIMTDYNSAIIDLERETGQAVVREKAQYSKQLVEVEKSYQKSVSREADDFTRQRANQERRLNLDILDIAQDSARQRVRWERDLARNIAKAETDSAERVADARKDANKQLVELDKDFKKDQKRREADFKDDMLGAAGRLDAVQLLELRKGRARELEDAKAAHDEQRTELQAQLDERIDEEGKSLAKSIAAQQEAHALQLADQKENDRLRVEDMKAAFEEQKTQADAERKIMNDRRAQDYTDQLTALATAHQDRLTQIGEQEQEARDKLKGERDKALAAEEIYTAAMEAKMERQKYAAIKALDEIFGHLPGYKAPPDALPPGAGMGEDASPPGLGASATASGLSYGTGASYVMPRATTGGNGNTANTKTINLHQGAVVIYGDGLNEQQVVDILIRELEAA